MQSNCIHERIYVKLLNYRLESDVNDTYIVLLEQRPSWCTGVVTEILLKVALNTMPLSIARAADGINTSGRCLLQWVMECTIFCHKGDNQNKIITDFIFLMAVNQTTGLITIRN